MLEISNTIKVPKEQIKNVNYRNYIYLKKGQVDEYVQNFWIDNKYYYFPRNITKFIKSWKGEELKFNYNFIDKEIKNEIQLSPNFKLRDYQQKAVKQIFINWKKGNNDILLQAGTGFGKTFCMSYIITKLKRKTLILTDMTMLSEQMYKEISTNTNADIQIITKDTKEVKDVNIVTYQLLTRNPNLIKMFKNEIGLIIADEIQNTGAETIKTIIQQFPAKFRLGLSATPTRSDGLTEAISDVYSYLVNGEGIVMPVDIHFVEELQYMLNPSNYKKNLNQIIKDLFIPTVDLLVEKLVGKMNKSIMIAVDSKEIQEILKERYKKYKTAILNASVKGNEREQILQDYENEKVKVLIGYKVLNRGISIPRMEVLINLFAATTKENIEQLIGRLMRQHPKKEKATFIDFTWGLNMRRQYNVKVETYQKMKREKKINKFKRYSHLNYKRLLEKL